MTGGASLGLRTSGSYGSLQQFNGQLASPAPSPQLVARKPAKLSMCGGAGRGGERLRFARICMCASRRQRMLLLLLLPVAVVLCFLFLSPASKAIALEHHPCENFSFSPPPADRKRTGPRPCPVCYVPVEQALALMPSAPTASPILQSLNYLSDDHLVLKESNSGSLFGGYPSLEQRDISYDIKDSMAIHCGFLRGKIPGLNTGFDVDEADLHEMQNCHGMVVASAIFGNYDIMQQPENIMRRILDLPSAAAPQLQFECCWCVAALDRTGQERGKEGVK